jgi:hypothetical protein
VVDGHDEYWTSRIRDAFDAARDRGTNLAFVGANIGYWQIRYEDGERTIVGYKSAADPVTDPALQTVRFRELSPPRPECALLGTQWSGGMKAFGDPPRGYAVAPAALDDPWLAGSGFGASTVLAELVGPEWDALPDPAPEACRKEGLRTLFHYEGSPTDADAVRYTAPSGARVFSAGSLQFAWGLDDWHPPSRAAPFTAIPGLQTFVRNLLADLGRPAPPRIQGRYERGRVILSVDPGPDPRIRATRIVRDGRVVCEGTTSPCVEPGLPGHAVYAYAAVNVDEWGESAPLAVSVTAPNTPPRVRLRGPRATRAGRRAVYAVSAADADGDRLAYRWRVDGRPVSARGRRLVVRLARPGRHTVEVRVADGHGAVVRSRLTVLVRR